MNVRQLETDGVVIVGAGPVGLTLACGLDAAGIPVLLLERESELARASHASTFHPSSLEILDRLGVADDLVNRGIPVKHLRYRHLPSDTAAELSYALLADDTGFPFRLQCEQAALKPLLLERLLASSIAEVVFGAPAEAVEPGPRPRVRGGGTSPFVAQGRVVVGADGAHSAVRHGLGLGFDGAAYARPLLRIMTDTTVRVLRPELGAVSYMADDEGSLSLLSLPDHVRLGFRVPSDLKEDDVSETFLRHLVSRIFPGHEDHVPVRSWRLIAIHQRLADTFSVDNILLIGDAAHLNDPSGGMGMNSGIHDAALLAALLPRYLAGELGATALAARLAERRRVIAEDVIGRAESHRSNLDGDGAEWVSRMRDVAADANRTRSFLLRASMFDTLPPEVAS